MKKLLIITLLLCAIVLGWCSLQKWLSQDELFEKKQECAKYIPQVEKEFQEWESAYTEWHKLYELFYSPSLNTCLKAYTLIGWLTERVMVYAIDDVFTKDNIFQISRWELDDFLVFEEKIKKLKWE